MWIVIRIWAFRWFSSLFLFLVSQNATHFNKSFTLQSLKQSSNSLLIFVFDTDYNILALSQEAVHACHVQ